MPETPLRYPFSKAKNNVHTRIKVKHNILSPKSIPYLASAKTNSKNQFFTPLQDERKEIDQQPKRAIGTSLDDALVMSMSYKITETDKVIPENNSLFLSDKVDKQMSQYY